MPTTAVLGLGRMGQALARRLIEAGFEVRVWNRTPGRAAELISRGATAAPSVVDAVAGVDAVLVSLSGDDAVRQVLLPGGTAVAGLDAVVIDCSTVAPTTSRDEADAYPDQFVACPIAGAPRAVESGSALLIVAGRPDALQRAAPVLDALSQARQPAGEDAGAAAIIKLMNNYLLLGGLALLADAVAVAQGNGFGDSDLSAVLNTLPAVAPALKNRIDGLLSGDHETLFSVDLGRKDLRLFSAIAGEVGMRPGLAEATQARYHQAAELGLGTRDLTAIFETLRRDAA